MKHPAFQLTVLLLFLTLASVPAHAIAPAYTVTDLGDLAGYGSRAWGVNDSGQVVGYSYTGDGSTYHGFIWQPGSGMTDLGTFGGTLSEAKGISRSGQVVGYAKNAAGQDRAFLWQESVGMTDLGTLGGTSAGAWGVNELGQVVGSSKTASGVYHPFLWTPGSGMLDLGINNGRAYAVNDSGQVIGSTVPNDDRAFFWEAGTGVTWLPDLGAHRVGAYDINNTGRVVGYSDLYDDNYQITSHAFIWDLSTGMRDLGTLGQASEALGINDLGQVVGWTSVAGDYYAHAFIWQEGEGMVDLNNLLAHSSGLTITGATAISDSGYVVGYGRDAAGQRRAVLLAPVPEPAGFLLLGAGAASLLGMLRRRK